MFQLLSCIKMTLYPEKNSVSSSETEGSNLAVILKSDPKISSLYFFKGLEIKRVTHQDNCGVGLMKKAIYSIILIFALVRSMA